MNNRGEPNPDRGGSSFSIFLVVRVLDDFIDHVIGSFVDRTNSRKKSSNRKLKDKLYCYLIKIHI
jgi:hypothetical protein